MNLEHVSAAALVQQEISRSTPAGRQACRALGNGTSVPDETMLAALRRWFWTRKPDAGFVLTDFPATLLQAHVFDEWLDLRGSALTGVLLSPAAAVHPALVDHYRLQGVDLFDATPLAA